MASKLRSLDGMTGGIGYISAGNFVVYFHDIMPARGIPIQELERALVERTPLKQEVPDLSFPTAHTVRFQQGERDEVFNIDSLLKFLAPEKKP